MANEFRGKGVSATKFTKNGEPKHAGNWSAVSIHHQSLQYKDYYVRYRKDEETGIEVLIVGDHTPLASIMGEMVATLAMRDPHFDTYRQSGQYKGLGNGKGYDSSYTLRRNKLVRSWIIDPHAFTLRCEIYTDGDFTYNFPNY